MRDPGAKEKGARKTIRIVPSAPLPKPAWIRVRAPGADSRFGEIKAILRRQKLVLTKSALEALEARFK